MPWKKTKIKLPIDKTLRDIVEAFDDTLSVLQPLLTATTALLSVVKLFVNETQDVFKKIIGMTTGLVEDFINDLFGVGIYNITISPLNFSGYIKDTVKIRRVPDYLFTNGNKSTYATLLGEKSNEFLTDINYSTIKFPPAPKFGSIPPRVSTHWKVSFEPKHSILDPIYTEPYIDGTDSVGFPLLRVSTAIQLACESFYDLGDENRPQFSDSSQVAMFGVMVTAPSLGEFLDILKRLKFVFQNPEFDFLLKRVEESTEIVEYASEKPDWVSINLDYFSFLSNIHDYLLKFVKYVDGFKVYADNNLSDLADTIINKVEELNNLISQLKEIINSLHTCTGIWTIQMSGFGGNKALIKELIDPQFLNACNLDYNKYTFLTLFVTGGPHATNWLNNFSSLFIDTAEGYSGNLEFYSNQIEHLWNNFINEEDKIIKEIKERERRERIEEEEEKRIEEEEKKKDRRGI